MSLSTTRTSNSEQQPADDPVWTWSSAPVKKIVGWLQEHKVQDFTLKRFPGSIEYTAVVVNLKGGYILSVLTDPSVTNGQYAETGILKDQHLVVDKKLSPGGDCILRHKYFKRVVRYIKKVVAAADAGEIVDSRTF